MLYIRVYFLVSTYNIKINTSTQSFLLLCVFMLIFLEWILFSLCEIWHWICFLRFSQHIQERFGKLRKSEKGKNCNCNCQTLIRAQRLLLPKFLLIKQTTLRLSDFNWSSVSLTPLITVPEHTETHADQNIRFVKFN